MQTFDNIEPDGLPARFAAELESALMARALADAGSLPDAQVKALLVDWLRGTFNARAFAADTIAEGRGTLAWEPDGDGYRLTWYTPIGIACPLARLYQQADESWAALIVAGVKDDIGAAMAAAEWGVSRLNSS